MIDSRDLKELHPALARGAAELIRRMTAKGYPVLVTSTYRDNEAQNKLYAQGRTTPGSIVTNAKAGQSVHNYRLAYDICKNIKGQEYSDAAFFREAGAVWTAMSGSWASFPDKPHFEYTGGLTLAQLQAGKTLPQDARMPWELSQLMTKPKEETEVVDQTKIKIDGVVYTMNRIFKDNKNYMELQEFKQAGFGVDYDSAAKIPVLTSPKK